MMFPDPLSVYEEGLEEVTLKIVKSVPTSRWPKALWISLTTKIHSPAHIPYNFSFPLILKEHFELSVHSQKVINIREEIHILF